MIAIISLLMIASIGIINLWLGYEISLSVFYVFPIALMTWFIGRSQGFLTSLICAIVGFWVDFLAGHLYSNPAFRIWNASIRFSFFIIITLLLSILKKNQDDNKHLALTDSLTGAANSRSFYELLHAEVDRFQRYAHPFTVAYIDLDDFKTINDRFGHISGDQALLEVVAAIKCCLRKTDSVARLGGDEFGLLLPETDEESARIIMSRIQDNIHKTLRKKNWGITSSIGTLIVGGIKTTNPQELVKMADGLMYTIKLSGKNGNKFSTYLVDKKGNQSHHPIIEE